MTRIVTTSYRYKRPPRKRKPVALEMPAVVRSKQQRPGERVETIGTQPEMAGTQPDDRKVAIVTTSKKRLKLLRAEKRAGAGPEAAARAKAFVDRMIRPGGALPSPKGQT